MPDLLVTQVVAQSGVLIVDTLFKHYLKPKKHEDHNGKETARVDLVYDEAFNIAKTFLNISTHHSVAALQKFSQTRTLAPPWVAVHRLRVPRPSLDAAADYMVTALGGPDMAYKIAGGVKWWRVRAGRGVEAEWIVQKNEVQSDSHRREMPLEGDKFLPEMDTMRCMLYIHGGAYYWGSINTHRYTLWRYARKMKGRVFAVNYRKAPQYPFPCAIQDCLAAWLYLVNPPPGAEHHPIDPKNIIIAGDSAGGGLALALLQILRDTPGLELPAGAVLISPWSDLTHSFPSILQNTATDVVPPYSFIHKPSSLWPPPDPETTTKVQSDIITKVRSRALPSASIAPKVAKLKNPLKPRAEAAPPAMRTSDPESAGKLKELLKKHVASGEANRERNMANPAASFSQLADKDDAATGISTTLAQCGDPLRVQVQGQAIDIDTQIQIYATNAQLCHPWVSPALGYMGGLPPLLITCGDSEVLRDEIIYLAHKAANPEKYPIRDDVKELLPSLKQYDNGMVPTDTHLQVYDGVGHDLPLFSMTRPARGIFRAIASFARFVTPDAPGSLSISLSRRSSDTGGSVTPQYFVESPAPLSRTTTAPLSPTPSDGIARPAQLTDRLKHIKQGSKPEAPGGLLNRTSTTSSLRNKFRSWGLNSGTATPAEPTVEPPQPHTQDSKSGPGETGWSGIYAGPTPFPDHFIRERVDFDGKTRPLEPPEQLGAITMPANEIGMIKMAPAMRYIEGQALWDKKYSHVRKKVKRRREKNLKRSKDHDTPQIIKEWDKRAARAGAERAAAGDGGRGGARTPRSPITPGPPVSLKSSGTPGQPGPGAAEASGKSETLRATGTPVIGTPSVSGTSASGDDSDSSTSTTDSDTSSLPNVSTLSLDETWAWQWALVGELPPPSAIVSRRDLPEGRNLALMADRADGEVRGHALPFWVALTGLMSGGDHHTGTGSSRAKSEMAALEEAQKKRQEEEKEEKAAKEERRRRRQEKKKAKEVKEGVSGVVTESSETKPAWTKTGAESGEPEPVEKAEKAEKSEKVAQAEKAAETEEEVAETEKAETVDKAVADKALADHGLADKAMVNKVEPALDTAKQSEEIAAQNGQS